jgi:hypothetical protein
MDPKQSLSEREEASRKEKRVQLEPKLQASWKRWAKVVAVLQDAK